MTRSTMTHSVAAIVFSFFAILGLIGLPLEARAIQINQGDLVLALFSNDTEYYRNLGPASTLLAGPTVNIDIGSSPLNPFSVTAGSNPILWALLSSQGQTQLNTFINTASTLTSQQIVDSQTNNGVVGVNAHMNGWRNSVSLATGPGSEATLAASDPASWASQFGLSGTLGSNMLAGGFQGQVDKTLNMIKSQARVGAEFNVMTDIGKALLASNGLLSICGTADCTLQPVPVPAAVLLFLTGLFGLAAFARRTSLNAFVS